MTIFTDRDLERVAELQTNWRKELLLEVVRLRHERDIAKTREADAKQASADTRSPTTVARGAATGDRIRLIIN